MEQCWVLRMVGLMRMRWVDCLVKHSDLQLDWHWDLTKASNSEQPTAPPTVSSSDRTRGRETLLEHPKEKQKAFLKDRHSDGTMAWNWEPRMEP
jgi:hypothetical protein